MANASARMIGAALATAIMAAGSLAMAQTSGSGSTNMNTQGAPSMGAPAHKGTSSTPGTAGKMGGKTDMNTQGAPSMGSPAHGSSATSSGGTTSTTTIGGKTGKVETGNKAAGGSGTGTGQTKLPAERAPTAPMSGSGGK